MSESMVEAVFFMASFLFVLCSSYFIASTLKVKTLTNYIIYLVLILISQIIVSFEILSIFKLITTDFLLGINFFVFLASYKVWDNANRPFPDFRQFTVVKSQIIRALKEDKLLLLLFGAFIFASLISLFLAAVVPTNSPDSLQYHLTRIAMWIQNKSIAHFETPDVRQNIYSINSELLLLWPMLFFKRDFLSVFLQYFSYIGSIFMIFTYLRYLKVSMRRTMWTALIMASLPAAIIESSSTQTNLFVAFLLFVSLYLFNYGVKEKDNKALVFSAIAFSIDAGTKYSTFFFVPIFGIIFLLIARRELKNEFYKPVITFIAASIPAFLILSSYNYILNFIEFGNIFGAEPYLERLSAPYGIRTFASNLIRYSLLFIDFTGIRFVDGISGLYMQIKDFLFQLFGLNNTDGLAFAEMIKLNTDIHESHSKFGILGFAVLIPLILRYSFTKLKSSVSDKMYYISITGLITVGFVFAISALMGFCLWNNRFLLTPVIISSVLFALTYTQRITPVKTVITALALYGFLAVPTFNTAKPFFKVCKLVPQYDFVSLRNHLRLRHENDFGTYYKQISMIASILRLNAPDNSRIGLILSYDDLSYPFFEENPSWKISLIRMEKLFKRKNFNDYDFLVVANKIQHCEVIDYKNPAFDYHIENTGKISHWDGSRVNSIYVDKDEKIITSGKPSLQYNIIAQSDIPPNFRLINHFIIFDEPNDMMKGIQSHDTYIYQRMY